MKYSDKQILDWLEENHYSQEKDEWDQKTLKPETIIWRFYAGKGHDIRDKLSIVMEAQGVERDAPAYEQGRKEMLHVFTLYADKIIRSIYEPENPYTSTTQDFKDFEEGVIDCYNDFCND